MNSAKRARSPDVESWLPFASTDSGRLTDNPEIIRLSEKRAIRAYRVLWGTVVSGQGHLAPNTGSWSNLSDRTLIFERLHRFFCIPGD